jgi:hypothetical protein
MRKATFRLRRTLPQTKKEVVGVRKFPKSISHSSIKVMALKRQKTLLWAMKLS